MWPDNDENGKSLGMDKGGQVGRDQHKFAMGQVASLNSLDVSQWQKEPLDAFEKNVLESDAFRKIRSVVDFTATLFHYAPESER